MIIVNKGFINIVKIINTMIIPTELFIAFISNNIPNETKKITAKKSLRGFTKDIISILYGRLANATPAKKAPIAIDNPR